MSRAFSLTTLVGALEATTEIIGAPPAWEPQNDMQAELLRRYGAYRDALPRLPELRCWARRTAEELNAILREEGFDIRLTPWVPGGDRFGTVSIADIAVRWAKPGTPAADIAGHPAFRLGRDVLASSTMVEGSEHPLLRLRTQSGDVVCITIHDEPAGQFELVAAVARLREAETVRPCRPGGVVLPMVDLGAKPDLTWLVGLVTPSPTGPWFVAEAVQQVRFGMNRHGARAREATAIAASRSGPPPDYVVDAPFLVWFERDGIDVPIFQAHVGKEHWRDPGDFAGRA